MFDWRQLSQPFLFFDVILSQLNILQHGASCRADIGAHSTLKTGFDSIRAAAIKQAEFRVTAQITGIEPCRTDLYAGTAVNTWRRAVNR